MTDPDTDSDTDTGAAAPEPPAPGRPALDPRERLFCAVDTPDLDEALLLAEMLAGEVGALKLGKEFFTACGPDGVRRIAEMGHAIFLDLKFHDIPNTVAGAVRAAALLKVAVLTVHASGGPAMMAAAMTAARAARDVPKGRAPKIVAVTVLTSLDDGDLEAVGQHGPARDQVLRLARLAQAAGLDGVVCSPHEVAPIRATLGRDFALVVPGVRPGWAPADDQKRILTPGEAVAAGADHLVIGRPITRADDPAGAARRIVDEIAAASCRRRTGHDPRRGPPPSPRPSPRASPHASPRPGRAPRPRRDARRSAPMTAARPADVKICGVSDRPALDAAAAGGARYVGFVFYPRSPRYLTPAAAGALAAHLPPGVVAVALAVDPDDALLDEIVAGMAAGTAAGRAAAATGGSAAGAASGSAAGAASGSAAGAATGGQSDAGAPMIQLHGAETPARVAAIRARTGLRVMKAVKVAAAADLAAADAFLDAADMLLFDARTPPGMAGALPGGNAVSFDWTILAGRAWPLPWMLSGGLDPANVAEALRVTRAPAVDVSSGVESAPGRKDPERIRAFLAAVRGG